MFISLQVKIRLPLNLKRSHHLLFTFYHVSCDVQKSAKASKASTKLPPVETPGEGCGPTMLYCLASSVCLQLDTLGYHWSLVVEGELYTHSCAFIDTVKFYTLYVMCRILSGDQGLPVAVNLPLGYLSAAPNNSPVNGRAEVSLLYFIPFTLNLLPHIQATIPDVKWVDSNKPLFKLNLNVDSTIYTQVILVS